MARLTKKVFTDLTIWTIGLGLFTGIIFPFFVVLMGVPATLALTPWFFAACMAAGFMVSGVNIWLARAVVGSRLKTLAFHMRLVERNLREIALNGDSERCTPESCSIPVDSEDEIGDSSKAFNYLVEALSLSHRNDAAVRSFTKMLASQLELDLLAHEALERLLQHSEASAGAILIFAAGEMSVASSQGIRNPSTLIKSDKVQQALQTGKRIDITVPEDVVLEGVLTDFRPREILIYPLI
jgi:two-component system cell cycle response regulator